MSVGPDYPLAFLTGLLGGFGHCIGMCGPVVASLALHEHTATAPGSALRRARMSSHFLYHSGRVLTYTFVGALMGLSGSFVNTAGRLAGLQNTVSILAGGAMILMGIGIAGAIRFPVKLEGKGHVLARAAAAIRTSDSGLKFFPLGLLLGFLPCGLSYTAFVGAAATGGMIEGFLFTLSFGIGTVPALVGFGWIAQLLSARARGWVYRLGGAIVALLGLVFLIRGIAAHGSM